MRLLLDTHTILWLLDCEDKLSDRVIQAVSDAQEVYWSVASLWELGIKSALSKRTNLYLPPNWEETIPLLLESNRMHQLTIAPKHCARVAKLPHIHGDPFDRMLIAKAQCEDLVLVSRDSVFRHYDIRTLW